MKKIILILALIITSGSFAQQDLINYLFGIKYNYKDFNLNGNVKQLNYRTGIVGGMGLLGENKYRCLFNKKGYLIYETDYKAAYEDDDSKNVTYKYDKKNNLIEINKVENNKPKENYYFFYTKKRKLKSVLVTDVKTQTATDYTIEWQNKKPVKITIMENNKIVYASYNHQFDKNNNIIKLDFNEYGDLGKGIRKYDAKNNLIFEKNEYINDPTYKDEVSTVYDKDNKIVSKTEDGKTTKYNYSEIDTHNNWKSHGHSDFREYRTFIYY